MRKSMELSAKAARSFRILISPSWCQNMTTHTEETIASGMVLACLLIALFAILLAAPLLFLFDAYGRSLLRHRRHLLRFFP
jgi:hypothetical protein